MKCKRLSSCPFETGVQAQGPPGAQDTFFFRVRTPDMVCIKEEEVSTLHYLHGSFTDALSYTFQDIDIICLNSLPFFSWTFALISKWTWSNWLLRLHLGRVEALHFTIQTIMNYKYFQQFMTHAFQLIDEKNQGGVL